MRLANLKIKNFDGTGAPNNPMAYPVKIENGNDFETDVKKNRVHLINVK